MTRYRVCSRERDNPTISIDPSIASPEGARLGPRRPPRATHPRTPRGQLRSAPRPRDSGAARSRRGLTMQLGLLRSMLRLSTTSAHPRRARRTCTRGRPFSAALSCNQRERHESKRSRPVRLEDRRILSTHASTEACHRPGRSGVGGKDNTVSAARATEHAHVHVHVECMRMRMRMCMWMCVCIYFTRAMLQIAKFVLKC